MFRLPRLHDLGYYAHLRPRGHAQVRDPAARSGSATTTMWDRAEAALRGALEATGLPYELEGGRRRVLRPQDRLRRHGLDRAQLAARHHPARLRSAGALRPRVRRRGQRRAPPGGHPPRRERLVRAVHRHPDRALRRRVPASGSRRSRCGCCRSPTRRPRPAAAWSQRLVTAGIRAHARRPHRDAQLPDPRRRDREGPVHGGGRPARGGERRLAVRVRGAGKKQEVMAVDAFISQVTVQVQSRALAP